MDTGSPNRLLALDLIGDQHTRHFDSPTPNNKIPVIVDTDTGQTIAESGAILIHLAEKAGALLPANPAAHMGVLQWLLFQVGSVGPMAGSIAIFDATNRAMNMRSGGTGTMYCACSAS